MKEIAQIGLLTIFILVLIFHSLVLLKIIPYSIVWGSRLKTDADMYKFEMISILINTLFILIVLIDSGYISFQINHLIMAISIWVMAGLFALNTIGNLLSKNKWEKIIFTPITILLTIFSVMLIMCGE